MQSPPPTPPPPPIISCASETPRAQQLDYVGGGSSSLVAPARGCSKWPPVPQLQGGARKRIKFQSRFYCLLHFVLLPALASPPFDASAGGRRRRHTKQETWSLIQRSWSDLAGVLDLAGWTGHRHSACARGRKWVKVFAGLPAVLYYYYYPFRELSSQRFRVRWSRGRELF